MILQYIFLKNILCKIKYLVLTRFVPMILYTGLSSIVRHTNNGSTLEFYTKIYLIYFLHNFFVFNSDVFYNTIIIGNKNVKTRSGFIKNQKN